MKLDIGCGNKPTGHVNCDLFISKTEHRSDNKFIDIHNIPNFVRCDANILPFRDKIFSECYSSNVLEHEGVNATLLIKEMIRVTNGLVTVIIPHRIGRNNWFFRKYDGCKLHDKILNVTVLRRWLNKMLDVIPEIKILYRYFPNNYIPLIRMPNQIEVRFIC